MFVDSLVVFVIFAERIRRLISVSESLDTGPAQLEDRGQEPPQWPAVGPPQPAWARRGQGSASAPRAGWVAPRRSHGLWVSTSSAFFLLGPWTWGMTLPALAPRPGTRIPPQPSVPPLCVVWPHPDCASRSPATHKHTCSRHTRTRARLLTNTPALIPSILPSCFLSQLVGVSEPLAEVSRSRAQFRAICVVLNKPLLLSGPQFLPCIRRGPASKACRF